MRWLGWEIARKRRGKLTRGVLLLQDTAPAHTPQVAMTECGFEIFHHPPYFPDVAASDLYLFPNIKPHLRGSQYGNNEGNIEAVDEYLGDQETTIFWRDKEARTEMGLVHCLEGSLF